MNDLHVDYACFNNPKVIVALCLNVKPYCLETTLAQTTFPDMALNSPTLDVASHESINPKSLRNVEGSLSLVDHSFLDLLIL